MPRRRLSRLVASCAEATPTLPLVHTTDVLGFVNALEDLDLIPRPCDVFPGEPLLYFFYGRPCYRANAREQATSLDHYLPICLLFRNEAVRPIKRVFPFDSGAFGRDVYGDAFHRRMELLDFGLEAHPGTPGRTIALFFDSVDAYLRSRPKHPKEIDPMQLEARSFAAMINNRLPNSMDNRASAIEVQFEGPLGLSGNVDAVILPGPLADSPSLRERLVDARVHVLPYGQVDGLRPSEYVHTLFDVCYRYYVDLGILS